MTGGTKVLLAALLVAVIIAVAVFGAKRMGIGGLKPPPEVLAVPRELMDSKTLELVTMSTGDWEKLGHKGTRYKNPKTGEYTMAVPAPCWSCGKLIPGPDLQPIVPGDPQADLEYSAKLEEITKTYRCPICGNLALPQPPR
jgi:cytochrome c-type biogenesis protein CcmH/NrfF